MSDTKDKILLVGIGNDGRCDDGLGWAFAELAEKVIPEIDVVFRYQLQVEDAELISHYDTVVFVDSSLDHFKMGHQWKKIEPVMLISFTSHALEPEVILSLCHDIYQFQPHAFQIAVTGIEWELNKSLSPAGKLNLSSALEAYIPQIKGLISSRMET